MAPERIAFDPIATPFLMGMVVRVKDWAALKGFVAIMSIAITASFAVGIFYTQTNAMIAKQGEYIAKVEKLAESITELRRVQGLTNKGISHIISDMDKLTAQFGQMQSDIAKIRK